MVESNDASKNADTHSTDDFWLLGEEKKKNFGGKKKKEEGSK
jgi:hypothetical protein